jgi:hypothetical protein
VHAIVGVEDNQRVAEDVFLLEDSHERTDKLICTVRGIQVIAKFFPHEFVVRNETRCLVALHAVSLDLRWQNKFRLVIKFLNLLRKASFQ